MCEFMKRNERLKEAYRYLRDRGVVHTQQDIASRMRKPKTNVSSAFNGNEKYLTDKFLMDFNKAFKGIFNEDWLISGDGLMIIPNGNVNQMGNNNSANNSDTIHNTTNNYRGCGGADKKAAQDISDLGDRISILEGAKTSISVPLYGDLPVSAGQKDLATVLGNMKPTGWLDIPGMPKSLGAFPVIGCSMEPDIRQGDFVCIAEMDRWESVDPDKIYMVITRDDRMIKRLSLDNEDKDILWCISPNYPKFKVYKSEILAIYRITFYGRCM